MARPAPDICIWAVALTDHLAAVAGDGILASAVPERPSDELLRLRREAAARRRSGDT